MLRLLPDLQQGFSPTTKNARKMQNAVRIEVIMRLKPALRTRMYVVQSVVGVVKHVCVGPAVVSIFVSKR